MQSILLVLASFAAGALAAFLWLRPSLAASRTEAAILRAEQAEAAAGRAELAELRAQLTGLRHDVRGILSPALLVADGLLTHAEPKVKRAGEVMVRTVERAADRLSEAKLGQSAPTSSQQ